MFIYEHKGIRVRYADTDQMGYVYYGNYGRFYEIGRVEALRSINFSYREMEESGMMMPVYENYSRYFDGRLPGTRPFCLMAYWTSLTMTYRDFAHFP